jgi:hypothetical protein
MGVTVILALISNKRIGTCSIHIWLRMRTNDGGLAILNCSPHNMGAIGKVGVLSSECARL